MMSDLPAWMQEFRDPLPSRDPPDDLKVPTHSPAMNLAISMLASSVIGNDLIDLIGSWISAMARLNIWFKDPDRRNLRQGEYPQLLVLQGNVAERVYNCWRAYVLALEKPSIGVADREYEDLIDAVRDGTRIIQDAMR